MTGVKRRIIETNGIQMHVAEQGTVIWARLISIRSTPRGACSPRN
jgi:hypothetical protein